MYPSPSPSISCPSTPLRLITTTGISTRPSIPITHYCIRNARLMALTHNTIFRAFNSIYHCAPLVSPSTRSASDLLFYCTVVHDFLHDHHTIEDSIYFPAIEAASGVPGLMAENVEQHRHLEKGLAAFKTYVDSTPASAYDANALRHLIDDLARPLETHLHGEIPSILDLHSKIDSDALRDIYGRMHDAAERVSDKSIAGPFVLGNQDATFLLDETNIPFPEVPAFVPYIVDLVLARRYRGAWRFNCSDMFGNRKAFPPDLETGAKKVRWHEFVLWVLFFLCALVFALLFWKCL